jgi:hypothetical protein
MRSVSMGPSATHESGHFCFAQTGHSHFAPTQANQELTEGMRGRNVNVVFLKPPVGFASQESFEMGEVPLSKPLSPHL